MLLDTSHNRTSTVVANIFEALKAEATKCLQAAQRLHVDGGHTGLLIGKFGNISPARCYGRLSECADRTRAAETMTQLATAAFDMTRSRGHGVRRAQYRCSVGRRLIYRYGLFGCRVARQMGKKR